MSAITERERAALTRLNMNVATAMSEADQKRINRCRTTGKKRYSTHKKAMAALKQIEFKRRHRGQVYRMERDAYLCDFCDSWHLSSTVRR